MQNKSVWVVIPAAGVGKRMQAECPKQYLEIAGKTVLEHTLDCFLGCEDIAGIVVAVSKEDGWWPELSKRFAGFPVFTAQGGKERADTVLNSLDFLTERLKAAGIEDTATVVLVHDAARPCLSRRDLSLLLAAVDNHAGSGALLATPVRDTMKRAESVAGVSSVSHTEERDGLWHALTPQMAALPVIRDALRKGLNAGLAITDEASALEHAGLKPRLLEGESSNIKITRPADLALAEFFLQQRLQEEEE
ncbi:MAG: 2-C-methyl-D-erythritol 4-phosphate cytidylyltransferase [Thiolinea sp.]